MATSVGHPDRLAEQVNRILANPDSWNQERYHSDCGTQHCIAGHGQIAAGKPMDDDACADDAQEWYGLTSEDTYWLFRHDCTLPEMYGFASAALAGKAYFDADGYARDGFDRSGFDRNGFNRDGFNRDGYARDGYDRDRYHRDGFSRDGYDRDGLDRNGYDRDGYDRDGLNRHGYNRHGFNRYGLDRNGDILPLLKIATGDTQ